MPPSYSTQPYVIYEEPYMATSCGPSRGGGFGIGMGMDMSVGVGGRCPDCGGFHGPPQRQSNGPCPICGQYHVPGQVIQQQEGPCAICGQYHESPGGMTSRPGTTFVTPPTVDPGDIPPSLPPGINIPIPGEEDVPPVVITPPSPPQKEHDHKDITDRLVPVEKAILEIKDQLTEQRDIVLNVEQQMINIMDLPKCNEDDIVDKIYNKVTIDLEGIEGRLTANLEQINSRFDDLPQVPTMEAIVDAVVIRLGESDDTDESRPILLYYTVPSYPLCKETDEKALALQNAGYPIVITTLEPEAVSVEDVPRVFNTRTNKETKGASNIITLFTTLTL
jgi:hypothetical protein